MADKEKNLSLIAITCLASAQVLLETMDELQDTPFYRQSLKQTVKRLDKEIIDLLDNDISKLYQIDEEVMRAIQNGIEAISKQMASMDPARIAMLGELLEDGSITFEDE